MCLWGRRLVSVPHQIPLLTEYGGCRGVRARCKTTLPLPLALLGRRLTTELQPRGSKAIVNVRQRNVSFAGRFDGLQMESVAERVWSQPKLKHFLLLPVALLGTPSLCRVPAKEVNLRMYALLQTWRCRASRDSSL